MCMEITLKQLLKFEYECLASFHVAGFGTIRDVFKKLRFLLQCNAVFQGELCMWGSWG